MPNTAQTITFTEGERRVFRIPERKRFEKIEKELS